MFPAITCRSGYFAKDDQGRLLCGAGVGITGNMMERVDALVAAHVDVIVVDSAHGHSKNILEAEKKIKAKYPDLQVIAGNIATRASTRSIMFPVIPTPAPQRRRP